MAEQTKDKKQGMTVLSTVLSVIFYIMAFIQIFENEVISKHFIAGSTAFNLSLAYRFSMTGLSLLIMVLGIVNLAKNRKRIILFREKFFSIVIIIFGIVVIALDLHFGFTKNFCTDLTNGTRTVTTDLYNANVKYLEFSDGEEPCIALKLDDKIYTLITENTHVSTDEDYIQKRLDEQQGFFIKYKPHEESVTVEYYPESEIIKSVIVNGE